MTKIYIDENFSPYLAEGFDVFQKHLNSNERMQFEVLSIKKEFGKGAKDEDWIPKVGKEGGIVITQDLHIHTTRHQNELYKKHGLGVFFFNLSKNFLFSGCLSLTNFASSFNGGFNILYYIAVQN